MLNNGYNVECKLGARFRPTIFNIGKKWRNMVTINNNLHIGERISIDKYRTDNTLLV